MSRFPRIGFTTALLVMLAGCGSTVGVSSLPAGSGAAVDAAGNPVITTDAGTAAVASAAPTLINSTGGAGTASGSAYSVGSSVPATATDSATGANGSTYGGQTAAAIPTSGKGWDAKAVYIGVITQKDARQVYASLGAKNLDPGDNEAQAAAVVKDVNAHGGIFGRQVKIDFYDVKTLNTATNPDTVGNAVCTHYTQDRPVIAVFNPNTQLDIPSFHTCFARAKVLAFSDGTQAKDDTEFRQLSPYFFSEVMPSWNAVAPVLASRLQAQGYFNGWNTTLGKPGNAPVKIGILVNGTPIGARVGTTIKSAFAAAGHPGALIFQYKQASDGQANSVNYFKGNGVTHVIVTDVELTSFQTAAQNQQYKPRFGITTYNDPYTNLEASGLTPAGANNGALGVGWAASYDVSDVNAPVPSTGEKACMKLMAANGQSFGGNKRLARSFAESLCDYVHLTIEGAAAGGGLTGAAIATGITRIGPSFSPAIGFKPSLTSTNPFVPGQVRDLAYVESCKCFRYGSGTATL